jgi:Asp-tRNA(Asn)/Glu-tRNA(Gln) amidotransferase A subunit family amidase
VKWLANYAVLGPYDYLDLFEAPASDAATKLALLVHSFGHATTETWVATCRERFVDLAQVLDPLQREGRVSHRALKRRFDLDDAYLEDLDSIVVERVCQAGAIILGKTNTPEFGLLGTTENRLGDARRNPWNLQRTTGGSSGGAGAAVVAGLCSLATGSDGGGSIRIPSSFCGVYGIKPSQGRIPRFGGFGRPVVGQFGQSGPMTRTVRDAAILLQVLAGSDTRDVSCLYETPPDFVAALDRGVQGLRLGWSPDFGYAAVDPEGVQATSKAARVFEELGARVEEARIILEEPFPPLVDHF